MKLLIGLITASLWAGSFSEYPGSTLDKKLTEKAQATADQAGKKSSTKAFYSSDGFEKVKAFYAKQGKEFKMPRPPQKLEDGTVIQSAFFLLDGAASIGSSKDWVAVQNPLVADMEIKDGKPHFLDVRKGKTSIQRVWSQ